MGADRRGTLIYLYLKSTFTGLPWSRRLVRPDPVPAEAQEEVETEEDYPLISETERKGYTMLAELCLAEETQKKLVSFETLKDYSGAGEDASMAARCSMWWSIWMRKPIFFS